MTKVEQRHKIEAGTLLNDISFIDEAPAQQDLVAQALADAEARSAEQRQGGADGREVWVLEDATGKPLNCQVQRFEPHPTASALGMRAARYVPAEPRQQQASVSLAEWAVRVLWTHAIRHGTRHSFGADTHGDFTLRIGATGERGGFPQIRGADNAGSGISEMVAAARALYAENKSLPAPPDENAGQ